MKDLLGRELKDGDLCIGMAIGRNSQGMHLGIFQGQSVVYLSASEKYINKSCTSNTYLIANPTEEELIIKEKIQKLLDKEAEERRVKASMKTIPLKELEVGGIYKSNQDKYIVYLGYRQVTFKNNKYRLEEKKEGHCFARIRYDDSMTDSAIIDNLLNIDSYRHRHDLDILKGNKKLVQLVRKISIDFPLTNSACEWMSNNKILELTVK